MHKWSCFVDRIRNSLQQIRTKNKAKLKFQGQSARSQRWFDLEFDWIEVNFSTHKPDFYKKLFQRHDGTQDINSFKSFQVTIGNGKCVE